LIVYRLADPRFVGKPDEAMSGMGGLFGPARWHPKGHRIVYLAASLSLCTLEMKVQDSGMKPTYAGFEVDIPDAVSRRQVDRGRLPSNWRERDAYPQCQKLGLEWLTGAGEPALLLVPSAVVPLETNVLLNPAHPDARLIVTRSIGLLATDVRLLK
jgi:RES domain-containing protein